MSGEKLKLNILKACLIDTFFFLARENMSLDAIIIKKLNFKGEKEQ